MKNKVQFLAFIIVLLGACAVQAQTTSFTYQGKLSNGTPQTGQFDFTFKLFTAPAPGGTQVGATLPADNITATNGVFKVNLDFGSAPFSANSANYLEIAVRPSGTGSYTTLLPRQAITSTPYAIQSMSASNATNLGGVAADQYLTAANAGTAFVLNSTSPQASTNFNVSGNGTVGGMLTATTMQVLDPSRTGLRVQTDTPGGTVATFGGNGEFRIDAPGTLGGRFIVTEPGNVGIGNNSPTSKLTVAGTVQSTTGGFKFPDGSVQTTAAESSLGATTYITVAGPIHERLPFEFVGTADIRHLDVPNGLYLVETTVQFQNASLLLFKVVECNFINDPLTYFTRISEGSADLTQSFHTVINVSTGRVSFRCHASYPIGQTSEIYVQEIRLTAVRLGSTFVVQ